MSELQAEQISLDEGIETEQPEQEVSESASDTGDNQEDKITFTEEQQRHIEEKIVGKKVYKLRETERELEQVRKELEETKAKLPQEQKPVIPEMPDPYDEDFTQKMAARDAALKEAAIFEAKQRVETERAEAEARASQEKALQARQNIVQSYVKRAEEQGISAKELDDINAKVNAYLTDDALAMHIMEDELGGSIASYLAKNPSQCELMQGMSTAKAAVYIESVIKPKIANSVKKFSSAPEPVDTLSDSGFGVEKVGGTTFV